MATKKTAVVKKNNKTKTKAQLQKTKVIKKTPEKKETVSVTKNNTQQKDVLVGIDKFAEICGVSEKRVKQWEEEGAIKSEPKLKYRDKRSYYLLKNLITLVRFLREKNDTRFKGDGEEATNVKLKRLELKLKKEELELAEIENNLHQSADIERVMGAALTRLRINLLAIPLGVAPLIREKKNVNEIAEIINERICRALNELVKVDIEKLLADEEGAYSE